MALNREEFSFPALASQDSSHFPGLDSPPLWKQSSKNSFRKEHDRGFARSQDNDLTKSFSYVEKRSLWSNKEEEKMDMLWEDLNEELNTRSQSVRIESGGDKTVMSGESIAVAVGCGMKLSKKPQPKKKSPNVLMLMRVLKNLLVLRSSSQGSTAKTHPR